jgi:hypothetical protein
MIILVGQVDWTLADLVKSRRDAPRTNHVDSTFHWPIDCRHIGIRQRRIYVHAAAAGCHYATVPGNRADLGREAPETAHVALRRNLLASERFNPVAVLFDNDDYELESHAHFELAACNPFLDLARGGINVQQRGGGNAKAA